MVIRNRNFDILICAFDKNGTYSDFIGIIKNAEDFTPEELNAKILRKFEYWIQYVFMDNKYTSGNTICKYMFIYPEEESISWIPWKKSNGEVLPYPSKTDIMQSIYEYDKYGEILETYDKN